MDCIGVLASHGMLAVSGYQPGWLAGAAGQEGQGKAYGLGR